jgi:branched-chain amino acid aminotransferase
MKAWHNGEFVNPEQTNVPLLSHSFSRGSALFEVIDVLNTSKGTMLVGLDEHIERFFNSAGYTLMELPFTREDLREAVLKTVRENGVKRGAVKFFAYYAGVELKVTPSDPRVSLTIFAIDLDEQGVQQETLSKPVDVVVSGFRKIHPETIPIHAKVTGNYLNPYLAKVDAAKRGFGDVILLYTMGYVAEGSTCNLFLVLGDEVVTPPLRSALPGITRMALMETIKLVDLNLVERDILAGELGACSEAFFTSSLIKLQPIKSINGRQLGDACPGKLSSIIMKQLSVAFEGDVPSMKSWLTPV